MKTKNNNSIDYIKNQKIVEQLYYKLLSKLDELNFESVKFVICKVGTIKAKDKLKEWLIKENFIFSDGTFRKKSIVGHFSNDEKIITEIYVHFQCKQKKNKYICSFCGNAKNAIAYGIYRGSEIKE